MSGELPGGLAGRYAVAPLTEGDVDELYGLVTADRVALLGFSRVPREIIRILLGATWPATALGVRQHSRLVQFWSGQARPGAESPTAVVVSNPELAEDEAGALEAAGWRYLSGWAGRQVDGALRPELRTERPGRDERGIARLHDRGFVLERVLWVMEAPVDADRTDHRPVPDGLVINAAADARDVFAVMRTGFAGTFGFDDNLSFDAFLASRSSVPGHDPSLWFLATLDGRPVGAMTVCRSAPERSAMQVGELAVLPEERRRGVATAMLRQAFEATRAAGMRLLYLFADSESQDHAPALYESTGFEVVQSVVQLVAPLPLRELREMRETNPNDPRPDPGIRSRA